MFGALLTDLLKAFNLIDHELLIAKLNTYDFRLTALKLVQDYLSNRKPRIKNIPRVVVCCKLYLRLQRIDSTTDKKYSTCSSLLQIIFEVAEDRF